MLVLGIETTCDETACAIVKDGREILSNIVSSQIDMHAEYGGVVPELACRRHVDTLIPVMEEAIAQAQTPLSNIDLISVAYGPGLIGALLIGITSAKALSLATGKPFIGINHIEAHLYAALMSCDQQVSFPCLGVVISGGHTALIKMEDIGTYTLIGQTVDDAIGEAFDKVGKLMGLPYPAGPAIEALAVHGKPTHPFKGGRVKGRPLDFSFSGLKTAVLYTLQGQNLRGGEIVLDEQGKADISASFQQAVFQDLIEKTMRAAQQTGCRTILFGGGVANNQTLRRLFASKAADFECLWPSKGLSLDNAAMIAGLGYHKFKKKGCGDTFDLEAATRIAF